MTQFIPERLSFLTLRDEDITQRLQLHRRLFGGCLVEAEVATHSEMHEAAARWLLLAGLFADLFPCGLVTYPTLEQLALQLACKLPPSTRTRVRSSTGSKHWLHVMSIGGPIGGHTALLKRWVESDDSGDRHDVIMTFMDKAGLPELERAVVRKGGSLTFFGRDASLRSKAIRLREMAYSEADYVVLHCHMWDIVPTLAFGVKGGPPVLLLNHASHTFWVGASVSDLVLNLRQETLDFTEEFRAINRNALFRIPLPAPFTSEDARVHRQELRQYLRVPKEALVFLTVGSGYKYQPMVGLDFQAMASRLLKLLPGAYLVVVGPSRTDPNWALLSKDFPTRLVMLGPQTEPMGRYHAMADIYLEGFPVESHTALLEAGMSGLPCMRAPACTVPPFNNDHFPLTALRRPADTEQYLDQTVGLANDPILRAERGRKFHEAVMTTNGPDGWRNQLHQLKARLPTEHCLYQPSARALDRRTLAFWLHLADLLKRDDPVRTLEALKLQLALALKTTQN